jgi:hypothetical protein
MPPPPHISGSVHRFGHVMVELQPSLITPHSAPAVSQVCGVHAIVPQRFGPPPPQNSPVAHTLTQSTVPPQPSGMMPQFAFKSLHVYFSHTHTFSALHVEGAAQVPQFS